jgi:uncharacterized glyoxalase superfamily protein PhnB
MSRPEGLDIDTIGNLIGNNLCHMLQGKRFARPPDPAALPHIPNLPQHLTKDFPSISPKKKVALFTKLFSIFIKTTPMDSLSPNLFVKNIPATIEFYKILGFQLIMSVPGEGEGELVWAMMTSGNVSFMFQTFQSLGDQHPQISRQDGGSLLFYIRIKNIRDFFDSIQDKVPLVQGLNKTFYGATEFSITDPNNYMLTFAEDEA